MPWWDPTIKKDSRSSLRHQTPYPWQRTPAERGRRQAEAFAEGLSTDSDNDGYGIRHKPFGTRFTGGSELKMYREKHPPIFEAISAALARAFDRGMKLEAKKRRKR